MSGTAQRLVILFLTLSLFGLNGSCSESLAQGTVKIGAVQTTIGIFAETFMHVNDGLKDSLMIANDEGGINGKRIEYIMQASDYKVEEEKQKFDSIFSTYNPIAMFGSSTGFGMAIRDQLKEKYKVLYCTSSFSGELAFASNDWPCFISGPSYGDQIAILLKYIVKTKRDASVAFFHSDSPFGMDGIKFAKLVAQRLRLKLVADIVVNLKTSDFSKEVQTLKDANPDYVIFHGFVRRPVPEVIKQCRALGMTSKFMGLFWTADKDILNELGLLADGYLVVNPYSYWGMKDVPMIRKIMDYNARNHPAIKYRPNYYMQGFATGLILVDVLKRADAAGGLNHDGVVQALHSVKGLDTQGLTAPLTIRNSRFPVARVWAANASIGDYESAALPAGLETWITVPE